MKNEEWLGVQRIAVLTGEAHSVLRRYAEIDSVAALLGGQRLEGVFGNRFPASSLPKWKMIAHLHQQRAITPNTAAQALPLLLHDDVQYNQDASRENNLGAPRGNNLAVAESAVQSAGAEALPVTGAKALNDPMPLYECVLGLRIAVSLQTPAQPPLAGPTPVPGVLAAAAATSATPQPPTAPSAPATNVLPTYKRWKRRP